MKTPTQVFLPIKNISNDLVFLKDGAISAVLETTAVNFDLLSENEQIGIIESFAALLNSLNFSIQIVVRSKRLDISNYLTRLDSAQELQNNPLLKNMILGYKKFVETLIKENEVLDKQFFIVVSVSSFELGLAVDPEKDIKKTLATIQPRCAHLTKQLARCGVKAKQLDTERLTRLFYDIYNESDTYRGDPVRVSTQDNLKADPAPVQVSATPPARAPLQPQVTTPVIVTQPVTKPVQDTQIAPARALSQRTPFVVEELPDDYGTI